jgi:hypothetical protein
MLWEAPIMARTFVCQFCGHHIPELEGMTAGSILYCPNCYSGGIVPGDTEEQTVELMVPGTSDGSPDETPKSKMKKDGKDHGKGKGLFKPESND